MADGLSAKEYEILLEKLKNDYEQKITELTKKLATELRYKVINTPASDLKMKEIIRLFAFGYSTGMIFKMLTEEKGMNITIQEIDIAVSKIDLLNKDLHKYYLECKEEFKIKAQVDSGFYNTTIYKKYALLENETSISLVKAKEEGNETLKLKCIEQLNKIYEKLATLNIRTRVASNMGFNLEGFIQNTITEDDDIEIDLKNVKRIN